MPFSVYAPGKLVLIGEYAVLHGAPAVVAAVDRYLRIEIAPRNEESRLTMPHLGLTGLSLNGLHDRAGVVDSQFSPAASKQVHSVLDIINCFRRMVDFGRTAPPPMDLTVDARPLFTDQGAKIGLGSSAALTVAMIAGLYSHARGLWPQRDVLFRHALSVHRHIQGARGSGIDVAASVYGGFSEFQRPNETSDRPPSVRPVVWPEDLHVEAVWTGRPASTARLLYNLETFSIDQNDYYRIKIDQLAEAARQGLRALKNKNVHGFIDAVDRHYRLLTHLSARSGVPIVTGEDEKLASIAHDGGGVYKPSGAGGGDVGLVFTDRRKKMDGIKAIISDAGYLILDLKWGAEGVRL